MILATARVAHDGLMLEIPIRSEGEIPSEVSAGESPDDSLGPRDRP